MMSSGRLSGILNPFAIFIFSVSCGASSTAPREEPPLSQLTGDYFGQQLPTNTPAVFAPGIISGQTLHATPSFSPDGNEIYWAVGTGVAGGSRIWFSSRIGDDWTEPALAAFSESQGADNPVVAPDGLSLIFNSDRPVGGEVRERLWRVNRQSDGTWSDPSPLGSEINDYALHWQVSLDDNGGLYFGSERMPSQGGDDIFYSEYRDGVFQTVENLGEPVNSADQESMPFIDPEGRFLIFSRLSFGGGAYLYASLRNADRSWSEPINVTVARPDIRGECPQITPDGRFLFFLRYEEGVFNVYWVDAQFLYDLLGL
jgi:hypothetical protein